MTSGSFGAQYTFGATSDCSAKSDSLHSAHDPDIDAVETVTYEHRRGLRGVDDSHRDVHGEIRPAYAHAGALAAAPA